MSDNKKTGMRADRIMLSLAFVPFLNSATLFHMNGKVKNRKWLMLGWLLLIINITLITAYILLPSLRYYSIAEMPDNEPQIEDYLGYNYYDKYGGEYTKLPEYNDYLEALDKWQDSDEYQEAYNRNRQFRSMVNGGIIACPISLLIVNIIAFFYVISQRQAYLKRVASTENREIAASRLRDSDPEIISAKQPDNVENPAHNPDIMMNIRSLDAKTEKKIEINTATEDELSSLPGIAIVDAKKAIAFRERNKGFNSIDEFFDAVSAKPHIIVRLKDMITVSGIEADKKSEQSVKRAIDI